MRFNLITLFNNIIRLVGSLYYITDNELFIVIPLAIPAKEPKNFSLKEAIMNSEESCFELLCENEQDLALQRLTTPTQIL